MNSIKSRFHKFDYLYMFVLIIYMGQATPETSKMVMGASGNPIAFLLPIVLTTILWYRNKVTFNNKKFIGIALIYCLWTVASIIKYNISIFSDFSYYFYGIYAIVVAYIMDAAYGYRLLSLFEKVFLCICKISLILWFISHVIPPVVNIFSKFPIGNFANNVIYIYQWNESWRNFGCAWEPGRFSVMIVLAIYCNLCRNGIKFKENKDIWWLLLSLASTMSTTGFTTTLALYALFMLKKINSRSIITVIVIFIPIVIGLMQLDFMQEKIEDRIDQSKNTQSMNDSFRYHRENDIEGRHHASIDRFAAAVFEYENLKQDPMLGYSQNFKRSYFYNHLSTNYTLAHGFLKVYSMYGIILGSIFYILLFKSSVRIAKQSKYKQPLALFVIICMSSISYTILMVPVFTAFWFFGSFTPEPNKSQKRLISKNARYEI